MADKPWKDLTPDEKLACRLDRWRNPDIPFMDAEAEADYRARVDRLAAAIQLQQPDRVPIRLMLGLWPAKRAGLTALDAMTDPVRSGEVWLAFNQEFPLDGMTISTMTSSPMLETLEYRSYAWAGHGLAPEAMYQYVEREWMYPEEYDHLIADPTDYMLSVYAPRTVGAFSAFSNLRSVFSFIELPFVEGYTAEWGTPAFLEGLEKITAAARRTIEWNNAIGPVIGRLMAMGFPGGAGGMSKAPFDILADTLRGTKGIMLDMYRCPEKVLAACERLVPAAVDMALGRTGELPVPIVIFPLHKGADGFMSDEQFKIFYWPTLREVLLRVIDEGVIPHLFAEGRYNTRLEEIMDLPKGRTVWHFDQTDMARAKETIGTVACLEGNIPLSLMHAGTPEQMVAYARGLIDVAGEGGGYIVNLGASADDGKEENLKALIETVMSYGVY
ncbi:MAG: uroporphyrinogen decarboxylase [Actinobacteria bacterium]|nr:uroporphyrinogen decarboxylase [Actinomycetota bacterium]